MKTAVMYGAGNIGRGFIGAQLSKSGYEVVFIDVVQTVVDDLNQKGSYTVRIVSEEGYEDEKIEHVRAVNGMNTEAVANEIAKADVLATAVGVKILPRIVSNLAAGIKKRTTPLNILICENLLDADQYLRRLLSEQLSKEELSRVGLVEASIGRMVPVQTEEMKAGDPLRVCVERYGYIPVDKDAFIGEIPAIEGLTPFSPFRFYIERKLFVHNMGHATCAYLGDYAGYERIAESIRDPYVRLITLGAMQESALALSELYGVPEQGLLFHVTDLLCRFGNSALGDTCKRVGGDIERKLSKNDRLIGSALAVLKTGKLPVHISVGIAAAVLEYHRENGLAQETTGAKETLLKLSGLEADSPIVSCAMRFYELFCEKALFETLLCAIDREKLAALGKVV